ncbi:MULTISPECIES: hypothetical protein [Klebsiella pneumoniae complex]|uniref:hypothetical protein n=1 Tax=Klebsiella pneumoniae complex TaxID=3390273 RepID=UPI0015F2CC6F|nr:MULTISPECIES: hypothetical protein [Klebsiella]MBA6167721.1 hypothetical protein [Klebsiella variicola]UWX16603.1 hypothetical protein NHF44_26485 [Klebsiella pneumoniae]UWX21994.1 hypothetical protein NHF42_26665 [Klebsiella pneumoniae]HBQ5629204.1 hypothetical protein [Klebsiella pneumoniae]HBR4718660.1 hypothetical protein [Klebsiella pneumoniae]
MMSIPQRSPIAPITAAIEQAIPSNPFDRIGFARLYFPPEYAFTQNQKQRSRSARIPGHAGPEYAIANVAGAGALGTASLVDPTAFEAMLKVNILALTRLSITDRVQL